MLTRDLILNNFWWKVTALLIAIAIRIGFHTQEEINLFSSTLPFPFHTRELVSHPISITKGASDLREFHVSPSAVDITISGDPKKLRELDTRKIRATVDLSDFKGTNGVARIVVTTPSDFKVEDATPPEVNVTTVKETEKDTSK
jgi:hypothetical protein